MPTENTQKLQPNQMSMNKNIKKKIHSYNEGIFIQWLLFSNKKSELPIHAITWIVSQTLSSAKDAQNQSMLAVVFHLYEILEYSKLIYVTDCLG